MIAARRPDGSLDPAAAFHDDGGMAFFRHRIYLRASCQPQSFLDAAMLGTRDRLMSIYCAYTAMFYEVVAVVMAALLDRLR